MSNSFDDSYLYNCQSELKKAKSRIEELEQRQTALSDHGREWEQRCRRAEAEVSRLKEREQNYQRNASAALDQQEVYIKELEREADGSKFLRGLADARADHAEAERDGAEGILAAAQSRIEELEADLLRRSSLDADRIEELERWGRQIHLALDGGDSGDFDEAPARIARLVARIEELERENVGCANDLIRADNRIAELERENVLYRIDGERLEVSAERAGAKVLRLREALEKIEALDRKGHDSEVAAEMGYLARAALSKEPR